MMAAPIRQPDAGLPGAMRDPRWPCGGEERVMATKSMFDHTAFAGRREKGQDVSSPKLSLDENLRGLLILVAASAALVAIAYGAMIALTSPGGWAMKVAGQAVTAEEQSAVLTVWPEAP
jgi:hypothetical protein